MSRSDDKRPLPPGILADALQDRVHPASGRLLRSRPIPREPDFIVSTYAEAVAIAHAISDEGDELEVHSADCEVDEQLEGCTCTPVILVVGEKARA